MGIVKGNIKGVIMAIRMHKISDTRVSIILESTFDFGSVDAFQNVYENMGYGRWHHVDVDFSLTRHIDSSALGMIVNVKKYIDASGAKIRLINVSDHIRKILTISQFEKKIEIM